ncbi:MAG TPA: amylo-alpha-1,6-glucosidase [Candidatus Aquilonibacter sp.]|nr:amylo-alpha-1,6-glucosidase [Candidatus Aquilonibacter sp.]
MDRSGTQHYYIATSQSPTDDRARVLKYGRTFFVFDRLGDVQTTGMGEQGLFFQDTRHLSELMLNLWGTRPLLLSSRVETNNFLFTGDLANLDVSRNNEVVIPRGTLHVLRARFLWKSTCYEEFTFVNHGLSELHVPLDMSFEADFADIFEVRGMHRKQRGTVLPPEVKKDSIRLAYKGLDGVLRQTLISWDSAPSHATDRELRYELSLKPKERANFCFSVSCDADKAHNPASYARAKSAGHDELGKLGAEFPEISSSNSRFNDWISRSVADLQMMIVGNPECNYPYAGVPWFGTVFGRDGIITALQSLWLNPAIARGVLKCLASTQADKVDGDIEAEPGKILHEMRHGEMAALGEVPFGRYYGSVDATPLFIMLAGAYYERTADAKLIQELWPNIERALCWIDEFGDADHDGFVEYRQRGPKGLVQQGWKDSNDSIFHADGCIAEAPIALCEVQGYTYAAKLAAARLSRIAGVDKKADLEVKAENLRVKFEEHFWCDEISSYALALDGHKRPCRVRTSNAGHCLYTGIASPEHAKRVAETLFQPESFNGWGVRTVASGEKRYNPLSYHDGSIWPHDNSLIAAGLAKYGFKHLAGKILMSLLDISTQVELHRLPELFCGVDRREGEGPTLYPVACSPQAWAAAAPFLILQACLGVSISAERKRISFDDPYLPEGIPNLEIKNLRCGGIRVDLFLERRNDSVLVHKAGAPSAIEIVTTVS